jgi:hypothetical protein
VVVVMVATVVREKSYESAEMLRALSCNGDPCPARLPSHMDYTTPDVALSRVRHRRLSLADRILPNTAHWHPGPPKRHLHLR